jgi:hypothetical protein
MSDLRHCDGPECAEAAPVEFAEREWTTLSGGTMTLSALSKEKHFHNSRCLLNWAQEKTKRSQGAN